MKNNRNWSLFLRKMAFLSNVSQIDEDKKLKPGYHQKEM